MSSGMVLLFDSHHGIYIPKLFAESCDHWQNLPGDFSELLYGPEQEWYFDIWISVLDSSTYTDSEGNVWRLWQDGDLWAYCDALMSDSEYEEFFGEPRA